MYLQISLLDTVGRMDDTKKTLACPIPLRVQEPVMRVIVPADILRSDKQVKRLREIQFRFRMYPNGIRVLELYLPLLRSQGQLNYTEVATQLSPEDDFAREQMSRIFSW